ncbi:MAG: phosphotransferase [Solirubrobacteraceae bacterium]
MTVESLQQLGERIGAAYREEERAAHPVTRLDELPFTYAQVTSEWLTALLCRERPGVEVVSFRAEDADDLGRGHARIWVEYSDAADGLPASLFCKDSQRLELRLFNAFLVEGEVQFYRGIQRALGVEGPECLYVGDDAATGNSLLIFRDLHEQGLTFCTEQTYVTRALAEGQLAHVAKVHGRFAAEMDTNPLMRSLRPFEEVYTRVQHLFQGRFREAVDRGFAVAEPAIPERVFNRAGGIWPAVQNAFARQRLQPPTLTHNDSHIDNWYPTPAGELRLGDWQIVARGDPCFDLALSLSTSPTVDDRRAWERELIAHYTSELAAHGGPHLNPDETFDRYRAQLFAVLAWWTPTLARSVDFDFHDHAGTLEIIKRITTAIDDLDAFAAL